MAHQTEGAQWHAALCCSRVTDVCTMLYGALRKVAVSPTAHGVVAARLEPDFNAYGHRYVVSGGAAALLVASDVRRALRGALLQQGTRRRHAAWLQHGRSRTRIICLVVEGTTSNGM